MLLDSNIIIYAAQRGHEKLRQFIADNATSASSISYVEVLGYHKLTPEDDRLLRQFFSTLEILPVSEPVIEQAVTLRRQRNTSIADALIAATALCHQLPLVTHNTNDFRWITELHLIDPLDETVQG